MNKLLDFAVDFIVAFAVFACILVFGLVIGLLPIHLLIWLGVKPMPYGLPLLILWWCSVVAAGWALSEHLKRRAPKGPTR